MSDPHELVPRPFSAAPGEVEALLGALQRNRRTFAWKTGGLSAEAMRRTLGPSTVSLGGLVKHLALVEDHYFTHQVRGRDYPAVWAPTADDDQWEWTSAAEDSPEELRSLWLEAVRRSEVAVDEAPADGGLDGTLAISNWSETPNLRRVLIDLIEEYARHTSNNFKSSALATRSMGESTLTVVGPGFDEVVSRGCRFGAVAFVGHVSGSQLAPPDEMEC